MQWINPLRDLLNLPSNDLWDQLRGQLRQSTSRRLALDDLHHLLPDLPNLRRSSVRRAFDLIRTSFREGNGEQSQQIIIRRFDRHVGLDQRLPFADQRSQLVRGEVQSVEIRQAVFPLHFVHAQLDLAECVALVFLQIGEGDLEDAALECIVGVFETGRAVDEGFADT